MSKLDDTLQAMVEIARAGAALVLSFHRRHERSAIAVDEKAPGDPVTEADRAANEQICAALAARFPGAGVIAEESVPGDRARLRELVARERVFFVDPLDGTREFVDRNPEFCTMLGLAEEGRASAGVVVLPVQGLVYAGRVGEGAFVERDGRREPLSVAGTDRFEAACMLVSRSHTPAMVEPLRRRLGISQLVRCGSAGVKVARVADGTADLYAHDGPGMKHWDSCAPEAILRAAGGRLTDLEGRDIDYRSTDLHLRRGMLASNAVLHAGVLSAVDWARRQAR